MSPSKSPPDAPAPRASALLTRYRARLAELLAQAETVSPSEPGDLRAAVDVLVEALNADLLSLYRAAERGELDSREAQIVLPALEKLRNVLRHRDSRLRTIRDTLHKAVGAMPPTSQSARDSQRPGSR